MPYMVTHNNVDMLLISYYALYSHLCQYQYPTQFDNTLKKHEREKEDLMSEYKELECDYDELDKVNRKLNKVILPFNNLIILFHIT